MEVTLRRLWKILRVEDAFLADDAMSYAGLFDGMKLLLEAEPPHSTPRKAIETNTFEVSLGQERDPIFSEGKKSQYSTKPEPS